MKTLTALSVLQIAAIVFLASRLVALERGMQTVSPPTRESAPAEPSAEVAAVPVDASPLTGLAPYPDAAEIRRIVRQELAARLGPPAAPDQDAPAPDPIGEAERLHQFAWVDQEIDRYIGLGRISDLEMQSLQGEIAKLDQEGQRRMLGRLVRAMNSGELEGRL